jgi:hypothetical protein
MLPNGTDLIARWATSRGVNHEPRPNQAWFRFWEPFDTMVSAAHYFNAITWQAVPGSVTIAEPWTEDSDLEPMDRTIVAFINHPGLRFTASMRSGEHFITRVSFLAKPPPPKVTLGDPVWDDHVATFAQSREEGLSAFSRPLRSLVKTWAFSGHLELRPGVAIIHYAGLKPVPKHYEQLMGMVPQIITAALTPG